MNNRSTTSRLPAKITLNLRSAPISCVDQLILLDAFKRPGRRHFSMWAHGRAANTQSRATPPHIACYKSRHLVQSEICTDINTVTPILFWLSAFFRVGTWKSREQPRTQPPYQTLLQVVLLTETPVNTDVCFPPPQR